MDGWTAARQPVGHLARGGRRARPRAPDGRVGRRPGVPRPGARRAARSARDDHLHVGHDGRAEGRDAVARQPRRRTSRPARTSCSCPQDDVALSFLPLSHSFERMVSYIYLLVAASRWSSPSRSTRSRATSAACGRRSSPACRGCTRSCTAASWRRGRRSRGSRARSSAGRSAPAPRTGGAELRGRSVGHHRLAAGVARRPPGLREDPREPRRPHPLPRLGQRAAAGRASRSSSRASACRSSKATA